MRSEINITSQKLSRLLLLSALFDCLNQLARLASQILLIYVVMLNFKVIEMDRLFDYKNEYLIWLLIPFVYLLSVISGIARDSIAKGIKKNIKHHTLLYDTNLFGIAPAATKEKLDMVVSTFAAAILILSTLVIVYIIFPEAAMVCLSCVFLILILFYFGKTSGFLEKLNNRRKRIYIVKATVFFVYIGGLALFSIVFLQNLDKSLLFGYKLFVISFSLRFQITSMERFSAGLAMFFT